MSQDCDHCESVHGLTTFAGRRGRRASEKAGEAVKIETMIASSELTSICNCLGSGNTTGSFRWQRVATGYSGISQLWNGISVAFGIRLTNRSMVSSESNESDEFSVGDFEKK
jgi:hypothetical protein